MRASPHSMLNPEELGPASGFSHVVAAASGRVVYVAGQVGCDTAGAIVDGGLVAQLDAALGRVTAAVHAAAGRPEDVVAMTWYTTAMAEYRLRRSAIGGVYRAHFGRHFPAMTMVGVTELFDAAAVIEVTAIAVVPDQRTSDGQ